MGAFNIFISKLFGTTQNPAWADTQPLKTVARDTSGVIIGASDGQPLIDASMNPVPCSAPAAAARARPSWCPRC